MFISGKMIQTSAFGSVILVFACSTTADPRNDSECGISNTIQTTIPKT